MLVTPLIAISMSLTACSNNKSKVSSIETNIIKKQKKVLSEPKTTLPIVETKRVAIVYEKLVPKPRRAVRHSAPRRNVVRTAKLSGFASKLSNAAIGRLKSNVRYDGSYVKIAYPWGDVPANIGVCTDVVIRSYRKLGIDLQQQVHKDMSAAFNQYPNPRKWGLSRPDTNIDHRRVYNLRKFFTRRGAALPITRNSYDYKPGDLVTWMVGKDLPHIGVVVNQRSRVDPSRYLIVHNIARGPQMEDILFRFPITGHYRYTRAHMGDIPSSANYASNLPRKRGLSRTDQMNYAQLVEASRILNNVPSKPRGNTAKIQTKSNDTLQLAKYSDKEIQDLLGRF